MIDYRSCEDKLEFTERTASLQAQIKGRLLPNRVREGTNTGGPFDGKTPFLDVFEEYRDEKYIVKLARAIVRSWTETECVIYPGDILCGIVRPARPMSEHFSYGISYNYEFDKECKDYEKHIKRRDALEKELHPMDFDVIETECKKLFGFGQSDPAFRGLWWVGGYQGHTVPSYQKLMTVGVDGILDEIIFYSSRCEDEDKLDFYRACAIIMRGFSDYILGYARAWEREGNKVCAAACENIAHKPPKDLYEAAQLTWFYSLWDWVDCVGRIDQFLYPFYSSDAPLPYSKEEIVTALFMKFWEHGLHNMTIGGVKPEDGSDATNELTFLILQILRVIHDTHPRVTVRVHEGTDPALIKLVVKTWSEGMSDPTLASDTAVIDNFVNKYGVPLEDARDYTVLGCQELEIPGKSNFGCEDGALNIAKILEFTLNDGKNRYDENGTRIGLPTGHIYDYDTFEAFLDAFERQLAFFTERFVTLCNKGMEIRIANVAKLVKSTLTEACLERGLSLDDGGAIYNYGCAETAGASVAADSLYAIKKLVYDEKKIDPRELDAAISANFEGYESIRAALAAVPKFGNDNDEADAMTAYVLDLFWNRLLGKYKSGRGEGAVYTGACSLLEAGIGYGSQTWATPDGRRNGEPLGNTIAPRGGNEKNGTTAMLLSVAKLPLQFGLGGVTCNAQLPANAMKTPDTRAKIESLMRVFLESGGQLVQITTADAEQMKCAQITPEKYEDLIVRIGGFSIKFNELSRTTQDELISRYA